jgi:catechol 2,3-dioxygenase-like lactoylglutathione lyase family enzyme
MKRFHVHVSVKNLEESIGFYSKLFGAQPSVTKADYAKWMLDDPRVNFAISQRGRTAGVNHLGFQVDSGEELAVLRQQAAQAGISALDQPGAACCYARSDKHWIEDPQGVAWETFHTLGSVPVYGENAQRASTGASCVPSPATGAACC